MWYVYVLYFRDIPVYAGMTNNPVERYKRHYYWNDCKTYNFIRHHAVVNNRFVVMRLVYCAQSESDVARMECVAIKELSIAGFPLLNSLVPYYNHIPFTPNTYKQFPVYPHIERLPQKLFTVDKLQHIIDNQRKILTEYGFKEHGHYNMDHSKSISRPIRDKRAKCP